MDLESIEFRLVKRKGGGMLGIVVGEEIGGRKPADSKKKEIEIVINMV